MLEEGNMLLAMAGEDQEAQGTDEEETLDVDEAVRCLNEALRLQYRSALQYSLTSAALTGIEAQAIATQLIQFGDEELSDARRLIEKIISFEGTPTTDVAELRNPDNGRDALDWLIETETEAIEALQASIEPTGREGRSEALEHRLEHMIMRKQEQVDLLIRARRET
jgi:bacterioferritin (cytochrome b1)